MGMLKLDYSFEKFSDMSQLCYSIIMSPIFNINIKHRLCLEYFKLMSLFKLTSINLYKNYY